MLARLVSVVWRLQFRLNCSKTARMGHFYSFEGSNIAYYFARRGYHWLSPFLLPGHGTFGSKWLRSKHKKVQTSAYLFWHGHSMQIFGEIPLSSHNLPSSEQATKTQPKQDYYFISHFSSFLTVYLLFKCRFVAWQRGFPRKFAFCVSVSK